VDSRRRAGRGFRRAPEAAKAGLHSALAFPIKLGAQAIGVIELFSLGFISPMPSCSSA